MCPGEQRLDNLLKRDLFCKLRDGDGFPEEVREYSMTGLLFRETIVPPLVQCCAYSGSGRI